MEEKQRNVVTEIKLLIFDNHKWNLFINGEEIKNLTAFSVKGHWFTGVEPYTLSFDPEGGRGT